MWRSFYVPRDHITTHFVSYRRHLSSRKKKRSYRESPVGLAYFSFPENDKSFPGRASIHVWVGNDKQNGSALSDCYTIDARHLLQSQFGKSFPRSFLTPRLFRSLAIGIILRKRMSSNLGVFSLRASQYECNF